MPLVYRYPGYVITCENLSKKQPLVSRFTGRGLHPFNRTDEFVTIGPHGSHQHDSKQLNRGNEKSNSISVGARNPCDQGKGMTGLESIAMAVAHLERKDDGEQKTEESKSDAEGPTPTTTTASSSFTESQPRLVSVDAVDPPSDNQSIKVDADVDGKRETEAATAAKPEEGLDNTTQPETCHDPNAASAVETEQAKTGATVTIPAASMPMQQYQRPIALDLTTPADASHASMMMSGGAMNFHKLGQLSVPSNYSQYPPTRLPNQISQKILLKHQTEDGASDDPIASILARISQITSDLPLLFRLTDELCEIGVNEFGPPAEVVPNTVPIETVARCDVLSGRGGETNHHYGNGT